MRPAIMRIRQEELVKIKKKTKPDRTEYPKMDEGPVIRLKVRNAGMVLVQGYIKMLFDRLEFLDNDLFKTEQHRHKAVHYLQWLVTGIENTEEHDMILNKVLCGMSYDEPIETTFDLSDEHKELMIDLLKAMIGFWKSINGTGTDGFRGNWLVRDGILTETDERWELTIEKRIYDILLQDAPFSFSIIKYPWMNKPLHVTWPYN